MITYERLFAAIDARNDEFLRVWEDCCNLESPSEDKAAVDAVGRYFLALGDAFGWKHEICPMERAGDVVCLTMNPDAKGKPVVVSGHVDTVHPVGSFGTPAVHRDETKIYGPGVCDCKGGVAAAALAMAALGDCGFDARPVELILQTDEEISNRLSDKATVRYMAEKGREAEAFLNLESYKPGKIVTRRKGSMRWRITVHGTAAHSSRCWLGKNALTEAAHKIIELEKWKEEDGITCNCAIIEAGATANSVPDTCTFTADIRFPDDAAEQRAVNRLHEICDTSYIGGTTCDAVRYTRRTSMTETDAVLGLFEKLRDIYAAAGLPPVERGMATGGSDASDIAAYGIPCIDSIGAEGGCLHSRDEFAYLASLAESAKRIGAAILGL